MYMTNWNSGFYRENVIYVGIGIDLIHQKRNSPHEQA